MRVYRKFGFIADFKHLLGLLGHHQHQIEVVRSQRVFVEVIDINEEEKVLQSFLSTGRTRTFRRLHWTPKANSQELRKASSPESSWCRHLAARGLSAERSPTQEPSSSRETSVWTENTWRNKNISFNVPSNLYLLLNKRFPF